MEPNNEMKQQTVFKESKEVKPDSNNEILQTSSGLQQNLAGLLCYLFGFITGIIFLLIEKENRFVRYHAVQSIIVSAILIILNMVLTAIPLIGWIIGILLTPLYLVLWIYMMWKAYQNTWFKIPIAGEIASKQVNK